MQCSRAVITLARSPEGLRLGVLVEVGSAGVSAAPKLCARMLCSLDVCYRLGGNGVKGGGGGLPVPPVPPVPVQVPT